MIIKLSNIFIAILRFGLFVRVSSSRIYNTADRQNKSKKAKRIDTTIVTRLPVSLKARPRTDKTLSMCPTRYMKPLL